MAAKPSIVFAHGLWADGSCFSKVMGPPRCTGWPARSCSSVTPTAAP